MTKGPLDVLEALDRADRQAEMIKNDPAGAWCTLRELGVFVMPGQAWNKTYWMPGEFFDWEARAKAVQQDQMAQDQLNLAGQPASTNSAISGIVHRTLRRS